MSDFIIYGIKNCDTMKKAFKWLDDNGIDYSFHDYRKQGLERNLLEALVADAGWEVLLNKRGTTWRKLDDAIKNNVNVESALELMLEQPAMIKRPVLVKAGKTLVGFNPDLYEDFTK